MQIGNTDVVFHFTRSAYLTGSSVCRRGWEKPEIQNKSFIISSRHYRKPWKKRFQNLLTMLKQCKDIYNHWLDKAFRVSEFKQYFIIMNLSSLKVVHSYKQIAGSWGVKVLLKDGKVRWVLWGLALITEMIIKWRNHADLQQVERCFVAANRDLYC